MNRLLLPAIVCALWCATTVSKAQGTHERIVMTEAQMAVAAMLNYGQDDVAAHFNGMMIEVPAGDGTLELDVHTLGNATLGVKVGKQEARLITQGSRGKAQVSYSTDVPSNLYIYAAAPQGIQPQTASSKPLRLAASANSVKLYSFSLGSAPTAIETPTAATSSVKAYYDLEGRRISSPQGKGVYIVKMRNGTAKKVLVR